MATLVLTVAGAALGAAVLPAGLTILGATISGAALGAAIGGTIGGYIDQRLFAQTTRVQNSQQGARLSSVNITASTEGAGIVRLQGRSRLSGQIVWATRFEEEVRTETSSQSSGGGGKGGGGGRVTTTTTTTTYHYYANFAVGLCEGPVDAIGRIWADGKEIDQTALTIRRYLGTETQAADALIQAKEGAASAPAYRGLAYVVFERFALASFGNRIPTITVEVFRAVGDVEKLIPGVCLIPGSTEFGYDPDTVTRREGMTTNAWGNSTGGVTLPENRHTLTRASDFVAAVDMLRALVPNCRTVLFVVSWFGSDLRCGQCEIRPKVEGASRSTFKGATAFPWQVAGVSRGEAEVVSLYQGVVAYGGTPNDASVTAAIRHLRSAGYQVIFYPFILMDVPHGNALPDPYSDNAGSTGQPAYPWRGRITSSPAPGFAGSPDQTAAAAAQVSTFHTRPWGYRNFILRNASLCAAAGGVAGFIIGSEMVGLTTVRSAAGTYPFVDHLVTLAAEVRGVLGAGTKLGYAANWDEYHSHRPDDGSGDVFFHLDPLWASPAIDFVGIDWYMPLSDWRDGLDHADYDPDGATTIYDRAYLAANVAGGEYGDWYYASEADRDRQLRTPIVDAAYGKDWVFANKKLKEWWANPHFNRPGGVESGSATGWVPEGKPVWITEFGCPAVDKGTNQPNVFVDPKSSESFLPHYSSGVRDDAIQRQAIQAFIEHWSEASNNPSSAVYGRPMVDTGRICIWAWDARPAPEFPEQAKVWSDAANWQLGHWISGRMGAAPARETVRDIFERAGFTAHDLRDIGSVVDGVTADRVLSPRSIVEALAGVHAMIAVQSGDKVRVESRLGAPARLTVTLDDVVRAEADDAASALTRTRAQETDLPASIALTYGDPANDDLSATVRAIRQVTTSQRTAVTDLPVVMPAVKAQAVAEMMLRDAWWGRETLEAGLPPSALALEPGDVIRFAGDGETYRIAEIGEGMTRTLTAGRSDSEMFISGHAPQRAAPGQPNTTLATPDFVFIDGPLLRDADDPYAAYVAATADPWAGSVAFWRSPGDTGFTLDTVATAPAGIGTLAADLYAGPLWRWDMANELWVDIAGRQLTSADDIAVFGGANALALRNGSGNWEIIQFARAELVAPGRYRLTRLLRGQRGSEYAMADPAPAGEPVVVLDLAVTQTRLTLAHKDLPLNWRVGPGSVDMTDPSYAAETVSIAMRAARPLSPAEFRGRRDMDSQDWVLRWLRRTRIGGDSWDVEDVPLGEDSELYRLDILAGPGGAVLRSVDLAAPSFTYTAAMQAADFGAAQASFWARVAQVSPVYGAGTANEQLIWR